MSMVQWEKSELCKPGMFFLGAKNFAGSYQIRGIQTAEVLAERWVAPCPGHWEELCPLLNTGSACACFDILQRSIFVHVKFTTCSHIRTALPRAAHVWDECDTDRRNAEARALLSSWDGVIGAHDAQGKSALQRGARRFWSIPHHSLVHCDAMPLISEESWGTRDHRVLVMGSIHNEAPREEMVWWAGNFSARRTGGIVKVIFERDYATANYNDLGLCEIFHRQNVTMAIAWQKDLEVKLHVFKPIERLVNPLSLGIPTLSSSHQHAFSTAIGDLLDPRDRETMLASSLQELQNKLEQTIGNYTRWRRIRRMGMHLALNYSASAVSNLYRAMCRDLQRARNESTDMCGQTADLSKQSVHQALFEDSQTIVARFKKGDRYFSVVETPFNLNGSIVNGTCVIFRRNMDPVPGKHPKHWYSVFQVCSSNSQVFELEPLQLLPNMAATGLSASAHWSEGRTKIVATFAVGLGLKMIFGAADRRARAPITWQMSKSPGLGAPSIIQRKHAGYVDELIPRGHMRGHMLAGCKFDSMSSTATFGGRHFVYARANLVAGGGGRFVQVVSALVGADGTLGAWSDFQLIRIIGYETAIRGDIYMFTVAPNPVDPETLLGVYPVNVPLPDNSGRCVCIAISLSVDGVTWSPGAHLLDTLDAGEGRTIDQVANGIIATSGAVHFYIHHDVDGVWKQPIPKPGGLRSGLTRYTMPMGRLHAFTAQAKRDLADPLAARKSICSPPLL